MVFQKRGKLEYSWKTLEARREPTTHPNPHMTPGRNWTRPHWCEANALCTTPSTCFAPPLLHYSAVVIVSLPPPPSPTLWCMWLLISCARGEGMGSCCHSCHLPKLIEQNVYRALLMFYERKIFGSRQLETSSLVGYLWHEARVLTAQRVRR